MKRRNFRNSSLGTATSANWNGTYRPWLTTLAPLMIGFSRSGVIDQRSASSGRANFRIWLLARMRSRVRIGLLYPRKQPFDRRAHSGEQWSDAATEFDDVKAVLVDVEMLPASE